MLFRRQRVLGLALSAAALLLRSATAVPDSPIPLSPDGHSLVRVGDGASNLEVEIYVDLGCTDCAVSWPTIRAAVDTYSDRARFTVRIIPLPFHRAANDLARAAQVVKALAPDCVLDFVGAAFANQRDILSVDDVPPTEVQDTIFTWLRQESIPISKSQFKTALASHDVDMATRYQWKYSVLHGAYGTPMVFIGGVRADFEASRLSEWQDALAPLLRPQKAMAHSSIGLRGCVQRAPAAPVDT